jgi:hypothetical protein
MRPLRNLRVVQTVRRQAACQPEASPESTLETIEARIRILASVSGSTRLVHSIALLKLLDGVARARAELAVGVPTY